MLFVCVHNAGRSQMAAALLDHHAGGRVHVRSAGSAPIAAINPVVVEAMAELGLDLGAEFPKPLTDDVVAAAMIDRLVHHAEVLTLTGDSYRTRTRRELLGKNRATND